MSVKNQGSMGAGSPVEEPANGPTNKDRVTAKKVLTDRALKALKPAPEGKRYIVWDAQQPHLAVRVTDRADAARKAASISFIVVRRSPGHRNPITHVLGRYPAVTLANARERTGPVLEMLGQGKLPKEVEAEQRADEAKKRADTFGAAVAVFIADQEKAGLRSWAGTESVLRRDFLGQRRKVTKSNGKRFIEWPNGPDPIWREKPILEIKKSDVVARLDAIKAARGKFAARNALAAVRKFFNHCADGERFGVETSPCANLRDKSIGIKRKDLKRKHVLNDEDLADVWWAAAATAYPYGPLVRELMLTGARLNELAKARKPELDRRLDLLALPPDRYKTDSAFEIMLTPEAMAIIDKMPKVLGTYLFSTTGGKRPISGFSKMKKRLDKLIAERRAAENRPPIHPWKHHDLRRSVRTRLPELGIERAIAELVIGHQRSDLDQVYDQYSYRPQKRDALKRWAKALMEIVARKQTDDQTPVMIAAE